MAVNEDSEVPDVSEPPALFQHCVRVYEAMRMRSKTDLIDPTDDTSYGNIWEGHMTKLISELNYSTPYYTYITRALREMECIWQTRRGGNATPSRWVLVQAPTIEAFMAKKPQASSKYGQNNTKFDTVEQQMRDLGRRVSALEKNQGREAEAEAS